MGGVLPKLPQRVLGIGGTGGMVHPATGNLKTKQKSSNDIATAYTYAICHDSEDCDTEWASLVLLAYIEKVDIQAHSKPINLGSLCFYLARPLIITEFKVYISHVKPIIFV